MNHAAQPARCYIHGAHGIAGTTRHPFDVVRQAEGLPPVSDDSSNQRTVACCAHWSADAKHTLLCDAISGTFQRSAITAAVIEATLFCCTLPMTHPPTGQSLVRSALRHTGVTGPYYHVGGHQCSGLIAAIRRAARWLAAGRYRHVLVATADLVDFATHRTLSDRVIQGDAAAALIMSTTPGPIEYLDGQIVTDPTRYDMSGANRGTSWQYFFTLRALVQSVLARQHLTIAHIAYLIPHLSEPTTWERMCGLLHFRGTLLLQEEMRSVGHLFGADCLLGLKQFTTCQPPPGTHALALTYGMGASWGALLVRSQTSPDDTSNVTDDVGDASL